MPTSMSKPSPAKSGPCQGCSGKINAPVTQSVKKPAKPQVQQSIKPLKLREMFK